MRPREEIAALQADFEQFVRWLVEESRAEPATYSELARAYAEAPTPWLGRQELLALSADPAGDAARLGLAAIPGATAGERAIPRRAGNHWLSPAEQLGVLTRAVSLAGPDGRTVREHGVALRRLLGPPEAPLAGTGAATLPIGAVLEAARWADEYCERTGAIPASITVGAQRVGSQALLAALRSVVAAALAAELIPEQVPAPAGPAEVAFALRADAAGLCYHNTWSIFPPDYTGERLLDLHRVQCWTAKLAIAGAEQ